VVSLPFRIPASTALASVASKGLASASVTTILERMSEKVVAPIPSKSSSTPMAAFQSASTRVRREVSASEVLSWVAHSMALTMTEGGSEGLPIVWEYR
jgi:hypothetical protein